MNVTRRSAVAGIAAAASFPAWTTRVGQAQTPAAIRAGMIPNEPASLIYFAADNGYFTKAGISVDIGQNPSTPALVAAVAGGSYDIVFATVSTLAVAHVRGLPLVAVAPGVGWAPPHVSGDIIVGANSPIKTAKDCNGKTFATPALNTIGDYLPRAWIDKNGGDSSTVKFIEIPFPQQAAAIAAGRVDAAYIVEPFLTMALKTAPVRVLAGGDDAIGPSYLATVWVASIPWAKAHAEAVAHFAAAMADAARAVNATPSKIIPILTKYLNADPALMAQANRSYFAERMVASQMQPMIDVTARYAKFPTFPASDLVFDPSHA